MHKHVLLATILAIPLALGSATAQAGQQDTSGSSGSGSSGSSGIGSGKGSKVDSQPSSTSGSSATGQYGTSGDQSSGKQAAAMVKPATGNKVQGQLQFIQQGQQVKITGQFSGLSPDKKAQFMIHEKGDCSGDMSRAGDEFEPVQKASEMAASSGMQQPSGTTGSGSAAGGTYGDSGTQRQPSGSQPSGSQPSGESGEYGTLQPDSSGRAQVELTLPGVSLTGGENSLLGRSVVVHESTEGLSQLTEGNGKPLACGVISTQSDGKSGKKSTPKRGG